MEYMTEGECTEHFRPSAYRAELAWNGALASATDENYWDRDESTGKIYLIEHYLLAC